MRNVIALTFIAMISLTQKASSVEQINFHYIYDTKNIYDHSDPAVQGSIAWYFKEYKEGKNYFYLMTPQAQSSYNITKPLILPEQATLTSFYEKGQIKASSELVFMLRPSNGTKVSNVIFDGNYVAQQIINGNGVEEFQLDNSVLRRTINKYDPSFNGSKIHAHGVVLNQSSNLSIRDNVITNIGDSGQNVANNTKLEASGLYLIGGDNLDIINNIVRYTLSAGINTTNSKDVVITRNKIDNIGRAVKYGGLFPADGITAYHNTGRGVNENLKYEVTHNVITNWYNHGIHLSGRYLDISRNTVSSPGHNPGGTVNANGILQTTGHAIFVGDFRTRIRCSSIIWVRDNYIERSRHHPSDAADGIRVQHYKHIAYWPSGNTGDVSNSTNVTDHRYNNLIPSNQGSCPYGYADQHYPVN